MKYVQPYGVNDENAVYIDGNPAQGIEGSAVPAAAIEHPMREIVTVIKKSGLVPDENDLEQLYKAIVKLQPSVSGLVPTTRKVNTTAPLTGGGDLSADRTLSINAVAAATANAVILRDSAGRAQVAAPSAAADIARKAEVDAVTTSLTTHAGLTTAHGSTSAATASAIIQRDSAGRAQVAAPSAAADIARKDTVDAVTTSLTTHAALTTAHGSTSAATASAIIQRDASGRAQVAAPSAAADIARKADVDANASIGVNQSWTSVARTIGVTYTNTTNRPLSLAVVVSAPNISWSVSLRVNGVAIQTAGLSNTTASFSVLVPPGQTYGVFTVSGTQGTATSYEMR